MSIRKGTLDDIEFLFSVWREVPELRLGDDPEGTERARCRDGVSSNRGCFLVYEVNGERVGFICVQHLENDYQWIGKIHYLWVRPDYRRGQAGNQLGNQLYERCEDVLINGGYDQIMFATGHDNHAVRHMGEKYGFNLLVTEELSTLGLLEKTDRLVFYGKKL